MTKDEALKLALEALEEPKEHIAKHRRLEAITAIKEALAQPEQKPVAVKHMMEWVDYLKRKSDYGQHLQIPSEMSAGACWDLARELEQFINTTPPQRKPLSDEEIESIEAVCIEPVDGKGWGFINRNHFVRAIEAAHGIKE